jgi:hypothetical protein
MTRAGRARHEPYVPNSLVNQLVDQQVDQQVNQHQSVPVTTSP